MTSQIQEFYERQREAGGPQALAADEAFEALRRIAGARGLRVGNGDDLTVSIFEFLMDSNSDERRPLRFRLQKTVDGGTTLRSVK